MTRISWPPSCRRWKSGRGKYRPNRSLPNLPPTWYLVNQRLTRRALESLDRERKVAVHQRAAAVRMNRLPSDPVRLGGAKEQDRVSDVGGRSHAAHGRPAADIPILYRL